MKIYNPFLINDAIISTKDRFYVAWLCIFQKQKNLEGLFDIAKKLPNIKFKVAGDESLSIDDKTKYAIKQLRKLENVIINILFGSNPLNQKKQINLV